MSEAFKLESVSICGAPTIEFHFAGHVFAAELAGAKAAGIVTDTDDGDEPTSARVVITDATGWKLADITIHQRAERNLTENVRDIVSALLWSHWRWLKTSELSEGPAPDAAAECAG